MKFHAPAKVNLNLHITGRRESDGYHLLDSIMAFTRWGDDITITHADQFTLTADGPYANIFTGELLSTARGAPNLIVKAVHMMADKVGKTPNLHIHVTKNIPAGAGLGGGSSNAAAVIKALNTLWDMNLTVNELCAMGLELGAELPVCIRGESTRVTGIGDVLEPIDIPPLCLIIVWPDDGLATKDVFDYYRSMGLPFTSASDDWKTDGNDLTAAAIELCPSIANILSDLAECEGCHLSRMSGSGSACFGVFENEEMAETASRNFQNCVVTTILDPRSSRG